MLLIFFDLLSSPAMIQRSNSNVLWLNVFCANPRVLMFLSASLFPARMWSCFSQPSPSQDAPRVFLIPRAKISFAWCPASRKHQVVYHITNVQHGSSWLILSQSWLVFGHLIESIIKCANLAGFCDWKVKNSYLIYIQFDDLSVSFNMLSNTLYCGPENPLLILYTAFVI